MASERQPRYSLEDEVIDLQQATLASPLLGHLPRPFQAKRISLAIIVTLFVGVLFAIALFSPLSANADSLQSLRAHFQQTSTSVPQPYGSTTTCNPFELPGQLVTNIKDADANYWRPWDRTCNSSRLFTSVRKGESLPWLQGKTVAVIGDSIDRDHVEYFCELAKGNMEWIWEDNRFSPPYHYGVDDPPKFEPKAHGHSGGGAAQSRPRICTLEKYNFAIVFVFHYGVLDPTEELKMPHYYPPHKFQDRLEHILVPILKSANRYPPNIVEFSTGSWDLQHWTYEDRSTETDRLSPLSDRRARRYSARFRQALIDVQAAFPDQNTALMLREMQHTRMIDTVPPPRVHALKDLQAFVLQTETQGRRPWLVDHTATLLVGQEHHFRDAIHPNILPAGKLWTDVVLHKLREHLRGR